MTSFSLIHTQSAFAAYTKAVQFKANSTNPEVLVEFAEVYYDYGSYAGALKMLSQILVESPEYPRLSHCIFLSAVILFQLHDLPQSISYAQYVQDDKTIGYTEYEFSFLLARLYECDSTRPRDGVESAYQHCYKLKFPNAATVKPKQWKVRSRYLYIIHFI